VFSISDNSVEVSRRLAEFAQQLGADLLIAACPTYYENTYAMLENYFMTLAGFSDCHLCLYDNPLATKTPLSVDTIARLAAANAKLTHVKVTDTAIGKVEALRSGTELLVYSGEDQVLWHQLEGGAVGGMVALPMIYPQRCASFWRAFAAGDRETADSEYRQMSHFIHRALGAVDYVAVIKAVLHHRGVIVSAETRSPLLPSTGRRLQSVLAAL
jgi:4-hydroxy-tetrahydrodipicolinate synthase